eukprot:sb/3472001/
MTHSACRCSTMTSRNKSISRCSSLQHDMGRIKKLNGEINEKILGKLPKVRSNLEDLQFDEDSIDGISILSFNTYDDLKEYYPIEQIEPVHLKEEPKKDPAKRRRRDKCADKGASKPKVKRKPTLKQQGSLSQFDKSESETDEVKNILVKVGVFSVNLHARWERDREREGQRERE